jgi:hypothetical protein
VEKDVETGSIEVRAETLEAARAQITIPEGSVLVSERILSDGQSVRVSGSAATVEGATAKTKERAPADAATLEEHVHQPPLVHITVTTFAEQQARKRARTLATPLPGGDLFVTNVTVKIPGSKGFLGIGKKPSQYEVTLSPNIEVELSFRQQAVIKIEFVDYGGAARSAVMTRHWDEAVKLGSKAVEPLIEVLFASSTTWETQLQVEHETTR